MQVKSTFTPKGTVNLYIVYQVTLWPYDLGAEFTIGNCLFGAVKLNKNSDVDK